MSNKNTTKTLSSGDIYLIKIDSIDSVPPYLSPEKAQEIFPYPFSISINEENKQYTFIKSKSASTFLSTMFGFAFKQIEGVTYVCCIIEGVANELGQVSNIYSPEELMRLSEQYITDELFNGRDIKFNRDKEDK